MKPRPVPGPLEGTSRDFRDRAEHSAAGVNFGSQDSLSVVTSTPLRQAAIEQVELRVAGPLAGLGNNSHSLALQAELAAILHTAHVSLNPTGWAASCPPFTAPQRGGQQ